MGSPGDIIFLLFLAIVIIIALAMKKGHVAMISVGVLLACKAGQMYLRAANMLNDGDWMYLAHAGERQVYYNMASASKVLAIAGIVLLLIGVMLLLSKNKKTADKPPAPAQPAARMPGQQAAPTPPPSPTFGAAFCTQCGKALEPGTRFCPYCGQPAYNPES